MALESLEDLRRNHRNVLLLMKRSPGTNKKSPEPIDSTMVFEIQACQLPPELPLMSQMATRRSPVTHSLSGGSFDFRFRISISSTRAATPRMRQTTCRIALRMHVVRSVFEFGRLVEFALGRPRCGVAMVGVLACRWAEYQSRRSLFQSVSFDNSVNLVRSWVLLSGTVQSLSLSPSALCSMVRW
jgi:hypothetical protein